MATTPIKVTATDSAGLSVADIFDIVVSFQNLTLTGTGSANTLTGGFGNDSLNGLGGNDSLSGMAGHDVVDGGTGSDKLIGGSSDDSYVVDSTSDVITENAGEGLDSVQSSVSSTLASNVENLTLTGTVAVNGTGNTGNNALTGNSANNSLTGGAGNDSLAGLAGTDTLTGGTGNDSYLFGRGYGTDTVIDNDSTAGNSDVLQFLTGVSANQLWFVHPAASNNLEISIIGTTDKVVAKDWYLSSSHHLEQFKTSDDSQLLTDSHVQNLVTAMSAFTPPSLGQSTLPDSYLTVLAPIIDANWQVW